MHVTRAIRHVLRSFAQPSAHWSRVQRVAVAYAAAVAVAAGLVAHAGVTDRSARGSRCARDAVLAGRCALLGLDPPAQTSASVGAVERALRHRFALLTSRHDLSSAMPSGLDTRAAREGRTLHLLLDATDSRRAAHRGRIWAAIARGRYDRDLRRIAVGVRRLRTPVLVTFDPEPNRPAHRDRGRPADFVAAWRHVHAVFAAARVSNAAWVWVADGSAPAGRRIRSALRMWPGNDVVDWIGWTAADDRGCRTGVPHGPARGFAATVLPFLTRLLARGPVAGVDVHKPLLLSDVGTLVSTPALALAGARVRPNPGWFRAMPGVLRRHPEIRAVTWADRIGDPPRCNERFSDVPALRTAAAAVARSRTP